MIPLGRVTGIASQHNLWILLVPASCILSILFPLTMHRALHIEEIISDILSELTDRETLRRAALTCRCLSPCALDFLWSRMDSPKPAFDLLGELEDDGTQSWVCLPKLINTQCDKLIPYFTEIQRHNLEHGYGKIQQL